METAHRKIELQAPADLTYLYANATLSAKQKLDLHFPPSAAATTTTATTSNTIDGKNGSAEDDDDMRKRVEELVAAYLENVFRGVKSNCLINGLESEEVDLLPQDGQGMSLSSSKQQCETTLILVARMRMIPNLFIETEPYDAALTLKVQAIASQIEQATLDLANTRRTAPALIAERYNAHTQVAAQNWAETFAAADRQRMEEARAEVDLRLEGLERVEDMQRTWTEALERLGDVKEGIGGSVARAEKARDVVGYLSRQEAS